MDVQSEKTEEKELTLRECFDQVLARHMKRLIGSPIGIGGLPLNLLNVSSLILLTEQITEELENFSSPSERYTRSTLFNELSEMGITCEEDTEDLLDEMIEKEYVEVDPEGGFSAKKPTISMAQLLDRVFPEMPGLNLIASLAQTMDEVRGGSKGLESSVGRFDQILKMQGVPLTTDEPGPKGEKGVKQSTSGQLTEPKETPWTGTAPAPMEPPKKQKLSDRYRIQPGQASRTAPPAPSAASIPPSEAVSDDQEKHKLETVPPCPQETPFPEITPYSEPPLAGREHEPTEEASQAREQGIDGSPESAVDPIERTSAAFDRDPAGIFPQVEGQADASASQDTEIEGMSPTPESRPADSGLPDQNASIDASDSEAGPETSTPSPEDQDIEKRIAEFENALTLQCPICETGVISKETTSTGKQFYKCAAVDCNFISWGRPFHITCPQCRNPFLVEVTGRDGTPFMKCPRATCAHWQEHPLETEGIPGDTHSQPAKRLVRVRRGSGKGKRKVVRRRVVKRKR